MTTGRAAGLCAILLAVGAPAAGCATPSIDVAGFGWSKAGAGVQQVTLDEVACARAAQAAPRTLDLVLGGLFDVARVTIETAGARQVYERCMAGRGYRQAMEDGGRSLGIYASRDAI